MQLARSLQSACERWPERPAITFRGETLTYAELGRQVAAVAAGYRLLGIGRGDQIVYALRDCPEHMVAMGATWGCGAIHAGTDADLTGSELAWLVERTEAAALVLHHGPDVAGRVDAVRRAWPKTHVVLVGGAHDE